MIEQWLESILTPCPYYLRAMGYLHEVICIKARYQRCRRAWDPHLARSRAIIRQSLEQCANRRKAVIFGSGMLLDVPLDDLAANFREVILVDLVHPLRARWHRRKYANVTPLVADVTGTVALVYRVAYKPGAELPRSRPEAFLDDDEVDLVASVNLISQLPYLPVVYLERAGSMEKKPSLPMPARSWKRISNISLSCRASWLSLAIWIGEPSIGKAGWSSA